MSSNGDLSATATIYCRRKMGSVGKCSGVLKLPAASGKNKRFDNQSHNNTLA